MIIYRYTGRMRSKRWFTEENSCIERVRKEERGYLFRSGHPQRSLKSTQVKDKVKKELSNIIKKKRTSRVVFFFFVHR